MHLITRNTDYAVRALCFLAKHRRDVVAATELFKKLAIPKPFLRRILQALSNKGVLVSYKGQGGGFRLGRSPDKIFLLELIEVFQGPLDLSRCFFKKRLCPRRSSCGLKKKIDSIEKKVIRELSLINISSLSRHF